MSARMAGTETDSSFMFPREISSLERNSLFPAKAGEEQSDGHVLLTREVRKC